MRYKSTQIGVQKSNTSDQWLVVGGGLPYNAAWSAHDTAEEAREEAKDVAADIGGEVV